LDEFYNIRIADFGFARWMRSNLTGTSCGSPHYAAPEVVRGIKYDGRLADIWSCGVILYALLAGRLPFDDPSIRTLLGKVKLGHFVMPETFSRPMKNLVSRMLCVNPKKRITIREIKSHPAFLEGFPNGYSLPKPIPLHFPADRIDPDPDSLRLLYHIGYASMDEAKAELASSSHSMAKVFYAMYRYERGIETLPWTSCNLAPSDAPSEAFQMTPEVRIMANVNVQDPFQRKQKLVDQSTPQQFSIAHKASWALPQMSDRSFEDSETWQSIRCTLPILMCGVQEILIAKGYEFFHPNQFELIARKKNERAYAVITASQEAEDLFSLNVKCLDEGNKDIELKMEISYLICDKQ
jgi:BR serine/threonine kinase